VTSGTDGDIVAKLDDACQAFGYPEEIQVDRSFEFTSPALKEWAAQHGLAIVFHPPRSWSAAAKPLLEELHVKLGGKPITPKERPRGENVVDLMEALRRSVGGAATETKAPKKSAKKPRKAAAGQKEMLMPIAGKKQANETAAKKPAARSQRKSA
jgi:hypothetical protein